MSYRILQYLSSKLFEGRHSGLYGGYKSEYYLAQFFKRHNLIPLGNKNSYYFPLDKHKFGTYIKNSLFTLNNSVVSIKLKDGIDYLLVNGKTRIKDFAFNSKGCLLSFGIDTISLTAVIQSGVPFQTSGCPGCNRPYYNERPGGILYNFPRKPNMHEAIKIEKQVRGECPCVKNGD